MSGAVEVSDIFLFGGYRTLYLEKVIEIVDTINHEGARHLYRVQPQLDSCPQFCYTVFHV